MTRQEFTAKIADLISQMVKEGHKPVIDWAIRTATVQKMLYDKRLSKCDGTVKISEHQLGTAVDIYLTDENGDIVFDTDAPSKFEYKKRMLYWHSVWDKMLGGDKLIEWDMCHFGGKE